MKEMTEKSRRSPMDGYMRLITAGGCLCMIHVACVFSPVLTEYFRSLGATEMHIGLLGGIPMIMLACQFIGAYATGKMIRRKPWFMVIAIAHRALPLGVVFLPLLTPGVSPVRWIPVLIGLLALSSALGHFGVPLWFSWIGDLIPKRILNRYWGVKHQYMNLFWAAAYFGIAAFAYFAPAMPAQKTYTILVVIGVIAGVTEIVLFVWVREPENQLVGRRSVIDLLLEPLRHREYRTFVIFKSVLMGCLMIAAAYMQFYLLKVIGLPLWQVIVIWCMMAVGGSTVSRSWGRIADRFGHRPIILLCVIFKPVMPLTYLLVTPSSAFLVLLTMHFLDSMTNAGREIAGNGYMLSMAPRKNRSMFVASIIALSGIVGGLAAILTGVFLTHTESFSLTWLGRDWNHYHLVFLISAVLRAMCIPLAARIRDPGGGSPRAVLSYMRGLWPMRVRLFPVGLYRQRQEAEE